MILDADDLNEANDIYKKHNYYYAVSNYRCNYL